MINPNRLVMELAEDQQKRLDMLMEKKAAKRTAIVNTAIKEMFDREIGELPKSKKK
jgi:hypothetical protein